MDIILSEQEAAEHGARVGFLEVAGGARAIHDFLEDGFIGVEGGGAVLAEVAELGVETEFAVAFLELENAGDDFEERAFSGAVGSDEHGAFAAFDVEGECFVDFEVPVGHVDVVERHDFGSAADGLRNHESERFAWGERLLDEFHALDLLELAHGLRGF